VDDQSVIQKIANAASQQFITKAKYVVVACSNPSLTINSYDERGKRYCRQQAGAALQNFLLKIKETGLATCWVGAFSDRLVREALKIPGKINVEAIFPIGYEIGKTILKRKIDMDRILYFNKYKNKKMRPPKVAKEFV
ncbi:MAG: nitroreductase family protein, partial [archaeon]